MNAAYVVQKAIRARLVGAVAVTSLVPADSILDRNERPAPDPAIILGEAQVVDEGGIARSKVRVFHTLHVWKAEPSLVGVNVIAGEIKRAIMSSRLALDAPFHCGDSLVSSMRVMRDPDGVHSHGVITVEALVGERA